MKQDDIDRACSTHGKDKKSMQNFGQKIWKVKTIWKTQT
jgi:hypothetical protein